MISTDFNTDAMNSWELISSARSFSLDKNHGIGISSPRQDRVTMLLFHVIHISTITIVLADQQTKMITITFMLFSSI